MKRLPKVGERVRYEIDEEYLGHRVCTGTVTCIYEGLDENGYIPFEREPERWSAGVAVDAPLPDWWPYPGSNKFAPSICDITPIA